MLFLKRCGYRHCNTRQYNQGTMHPIAENLSDYFVSSFEIRQYSCIPRLHKRKNFLAMGQRFFVSSFEIRRYYCIPRLHKRKNFLAMGQRFCKKTALFSGAAPDRGILTYCERRATMPITAPFLQKSIVP